MSDSQAQDPTAPKPPSARPARQDAPARRGPGHPQSPPAARGRRRPRSALPPLAIGLVALVTLVCGVGVWGATASISGAVIAPGQLTVEAQRQIVQHPDGGVVGEILVDDGDLVEAGQVLIRLDDTLLRSTLNIVEGQLFEIWARSGRLEAERDGADRITFSDELEELSSRPDVRKLMTGQENLFNARAETRARQIDALEERKQQTRQQIVGAEAQLDALRTQLALIQEELEDQQTLRAKGLTQASRVLSLQREEARLQGEVGALITEIARARSTIAELEIEILQIANQTREQAITTLRDLDYREVELRENRLSTLEKLSRLDVRAPLRGIIYGNTVFAMRSVIRAADPIMYVVPADSELIITAQIQTINVDEVHPGQAAVLRFSAFNMRETPELGGTVIRVSADAITDPQRGLPYYEVKILPDVGELDKLAGEDLIPGMPVEAYIQTGERSALNYFTKPLTDYFNKAFREE